MKRVLKRKVKRITKACLAKRGKIINYLKKKKRKRK